MSSSEPVAGFAVVHLQKFLSFDDLLAYLDEKLGDYSWSGGAGLEVLDWLDFGIGGDGAADVLILDLGDVDGDGPVKLASKEEEEPDKDYHRSDTDDPTAT